METTIALALLPILAAVALVADRSILRRPAAPQTRRLNNRSAFPAVMAKDRHWQRTTAVVERSIERATAVATHHASAARQLEAAEYALHCMLDELGHVMKTTIGSPLGARPTPEAMRVRPRTALAA